MINLRAADWRPWFFGGPTLLRELSRKTLETEWVEFNPRGAARCLPAIVVPLVIGLVIGQPGGGMIAAGGAMSVGFGSFKRLRGSRVAPMLLATAGTGLSTWVGTLAGPSRLTITLLAGLWGLLYGLLTMVDAAASWVGLQGTIALLVTSAYAVHGGHGNTRAALVIAGGLFQTLMVYVLWRIQGVPKVRDSHAPQTSVLAPLRKMDSDDWLYVWRCAFTLMLATGVYRWKDLPNGYWVPMTALIVLKADFQQTFMRGTARFTGTVAGAVLATLIAAGLRPGPWTLVVLVVLFAWASYALLNVNYAAYAVFITGYVVFLLSFAGLPQLEVVEHRALNTALGGALALVAYLPFWGRREMDALERG